MLQVSGEFAGCHVCCLLYTLSKQQHLVNKTECFSSISKSMFEVDNILLCAKSDDTPSMTIVLNSELSDILYILSGNISVDSVV